jgi:hypothetical protein
LFERACLNVLATKAIRASSLVAIRTTRGSHAPVTFGATVSCTAALSAADTDVAAGSAQQAIGLGAGNAWCLRSKPRGGLMALGHLLTSRTTTSI